MLMLLTATVFGMWLIKYGLCSANSSASALFFRNVDENMVYLPHRIIYTYSTHKIDRYVGIKRLNVCDSIIPYHFLVVERTVFYIDVTTNTKLQMALKYYAWICFDDVFSQFAYNRHECDPTEQHQMHKTTIEPCYTMV